MNYTIGGKGMTRWYENASSLKILHDHIRKYLTWYATDFGGLGNTDVLDSAVENISYEIFADLQTMIRTLDGTTIPKTKPFIYKSNAYNLTLICDTVKIKIWAGITSYVARENFLLASEKFKQYHDENFWGYVDRDLYRIEMYQMVDGCTCSDLVYNNYPDRVLLPEGDRCEEDKHLAKKTEFFKNVRKDDLMESIMERFFTWACSNLLTIEKSENLCYYPNDVNPGNFVIQYQNNKEESRDWTSNLINIDYDHMIAGTKDKCIHDISWQFVTRFYNKEIYPDENINIELKEWREKTELLNQVELLKERFSKVAKLKYNSQTDAFKYDVGQLDVNGNQDIYDYIQEKKRIYTT